jgi:hypothetical protein
MLRDTSMYVPFPMDTGAECNVLPLKIYQMGVKEHKHLDETKRLSPCIRTTHSG